MEIIINNIKYNKRKLYIFYLEMIWSEIYVSKSNLSSCLAPQALHLCGWTWYNDRSAVLACVNGFLYHKDPNSLRDLLYLFPRKCLGYILSKYQTFGLYNNEKDTQSATVINSVNPSKKEHTKISLTDDGNNDLTLYPMATFIAVGAEWDCYHR